MKSQRRDEERAKETVHTTRRRDDEDCGQSSSSSDSDDDDADLLAAAAKWATATTEDKVGGSSKALDVETESRVGRKTWSLHVTQLSFDATDYDVRTLFVSRGCFVTSVRLVYDTDPYNKHRTFRGVAFVDVADEPSYHKALELDRSTFKGRRINVRQTRSKSELANIVKHTKERVASKIEEFKHEKSKDEKSSAEKNHPSKKAKLTNIPKRDSGRESGKTEELCEHKTSTGKGGPREKERSATARHKKSDHKLTKKERNRRAAIIASRSRSKGRK